MAELNLTKKQTSEYLDHVEQVMESRFASAGTAADNLNCPLAKAYKFHHPGSLVLMGHFNSEIDGHPYDYRAWQKRLIEKIDELDPGGEPDRVLPDASVDYVRSLLEWV